MRFIVLCFVILALIAMAKAEEGCRYGGILYPIGTSTIKNECQSIECVGGNDFKLDHCAMPSVYCKDISLYYETLADLSKKFPECCPKYGCREE